MAVRYFASRLLAARLQNYSFNFKAITIVAKSNAFSLIIPMVCFLLSPLYRGSVRMSVPLSSLLCDARVQTLPPNCGSVKFESR